MKSIKILSLPLLAMVVLSTNCSTPNKTTKGAAIGTGGGAVVGAVIGRNMDKQAEEMRKVLGDSAVQREGEGIVINFNDKVLFATNQSTLNDPAKASLDKLAKILIDYPDTEIDIIGHTDNQGSDDYNQTLSQKRAEAVSDYLVTKNVAAGRLMKMGKGENDPLADNSTEDGRARNRRVEFVIVANEKMKAGAKNQGSN